MSSLTSSSVRSVGVQGIVERGLQLAGSGRVKTVTELKQRLRLEGFTASEIGSIGPALTRQLAVILKSSLSHATVESPDTANLAKDDAKSRETR